MDCMTTGLDVFFFLSHLSKVTYEQDLLHRYIFIF